MIGPAVAAADIILIAGAALEARGRNSMSAAMALIFRTVMS